MSFLTQRVILITGAVGNLGLATARAAQKAGARTVLLDRSLERLTHAYADLVSNRDHLLLGGVDLSDESSVSAAIEKAIRHFGRIDGLVNTVGAWRGGTPVHQSSLADWTSLFELNVRTTLLTCRAVVPYFIAQRSGRIINVASRAALIGDAGSAAYSVAKSGVLRLTESLAAELKAEGINVNCVLPSTIDTPQNRAAMPSADHSKWVSAEAIADVITFLASDGARAIHGVALPVYGLS
jgi:NAD(P)-dependent dehydrogenase (short-subunit alcohol dehydrogenase family)